MDASSTSSTEAASTAGEADPPAAPPPPTAPTFGLRASLKILGLALLAALVIRALLIEGFRIPTESMAESLQVGDFVLVSKLHYGPRLPLSLGLPLTGLYLHGVALPAVRLPGFSSVRRGDALVFNYPAEEGPVDRRSHYIKRVVGLPGDTVAIVHKELVVNGRRLPFSPTMRHRWRAFPAPGAVLPIEAVRRLGASLAAYTGRTRSELMFEATRDVAETVALLPAVQRVEPEVQAQAQDVSFGRRTFPLRSGFFRDQYGPLPVPARGDTLHITEANWFRYRDVIVRYEGHTARLLRDGTVIIDGERTHTYVVEQDYYFVLGDNRDSSVDSRIWGFVPEPYVVGKAVLVYFSWDHQAQRPRLDRLFRSVPRPDGWD